MADAAGVVQMSDQSVQYMLLSLIKSNAVLLINVAALHAERIFNYDYVKNNLSEQFMPYVAAIGVLGFMGANIDRQSIERVVRSLDVPINNEILDNLSKMESHENYLIYANAIHFIKSIGKEPTLALLMRVSKALGIEPDEQHAESVINIYKNPPKYSADVSDPSVKFRNGGKGYLLRIKSQELIKAAYSTAYQMVVRDFYRTYHDANIQALGRVAVPYLAAAVALSYDGRNVTKESISTLLESIDIPPNAEIINEMTSLYHENNVVYVYAALAVVATGREPLPEAVGRTAQALGASTIDIQLAEFAILLFKTYKFSTNILGI